MRDNLARQEERREELIGGNVTAMSPRPMFNHNRIASNIYWIFENYLRGRICTPIADGTDLYLSDREQYVPDGMIVCDRDKIQRKGVYGAPDLVLEVLSHSTAKYDRGHKRDVYEACGVKEYWIVDPDKESIEQYLLKDTGRFDLAAIYKIYSEEELEDMDQEERAAVKMVFQCSLFPELDIHVEDVFDGLL